MRACAGARVPARVTMDCSSAQPCDRNLYVLCTLFLFPTHVIKELPLLLHTNMRRLGARALPPRRRHRLRPFAFGAAHPLDHLGGRRCVVCQRHAGRARGRVRWRGGIVASAVAVVPRRPLRARVEHRRHGRVEGVFEHLFELERIDHDRFPFLLVGLLHLGVARARPRHEVVGSRGHALLVHAASALGQLLHLLFAARQARALAGEQPREAEALPFERVLHDDLGLHHGSVGAVGDLHALVVHARRKGHRLLCGRVSVDLAIGGHRGAPEAGARAEADRRGVW